MFDGREANVAFLSWRSKQVPWMRWWGFSPPDNAANGEFRSCHWVVVGETPTCFSSKRQIQATYNNYYLSLIFIKGKKILFKLYLVLIMQQIKNSNSEKWKLFFHICKIFQYQFKQSLKNKHHSIRNFTSIPKQLK